MEKHQIIFEKIKILLQKYCSEKVQISTDKYNETHIAIDESEIWLSCDENYLTIGYGMGHHHYDSETDNFYKVIEELFYLLTKRIRVTEYYKGNHCYKTKTEVEQTDSFFEERSTSINFFVPFWKKTTKKVSFKEKVTEQNLIETEIKEIRNYAYSNKNP
ncbi:hypothetical protein Fleli_3233 [Bernardetia litoralis DSM 6794]|uniref:Uncharacterized protein n=1 Tax=Bernardetia litoralis (strain ATCC 23117 / DSM 6794 / NBRC 15988 / NCIMB 1366 / Fx l1 / Sio-4) TaxID=880071 RepID=I4ANM9_BERLS|nr:hypothetical protein [Bernardetia litoralis]AFM05564.1 hypothetical protein Fleli_3233 [Bernardetia litoralis DSM 6794]